MSIQKLKATLVLENGKTIDVESIHISRYLGVTMEENELVIDYFRGVSEIQSISYYGEIIKEGVKITPDISILKIPYSENIYQQRKLQ